MSSAGNVSAFLMVFNPELLIGRGPFDAHMKAWIETYRSASGSAGRYPGQRAAETEAVRSRHGIPLPPSIEAELRSVGESVNMTFTPQPKAL